MSQKNCIINILKKLNEKPSAPFFLNILFLILLSLLLFSIYFPSLKGPFVFDDIDHIPRISAIRLTHLTFANLKTAAFEATHPKRPVANLTIAFNYYFGNYDTFGYHALNVAIHITTAFLLYLLIKAIISLPINQTAGFKHAWIPFAAALLWAVHPLQTQSVSYIIQRMNSLAALFYLLCFYCYLRARVSNHTTPKWIFSLIALIAFILALGSKENSASLPFLIIIFEILFFQNLKFKIFKKNPFILIGVCLFVIGLILIFFKGNNPLTTFLNGYNSRDFTLKERLLTQSRVIFHYLELITFPHPDRLNLDIDFPLSSSLISPITTLFSFIGIFGSIAISFFIAKKERLIAFCIIWFFGNLAIESTIIPLEIIFEHRAYLPSMMVILLFCLLISKLDNRFINQANSTTFVIIGFISTITLFSYWTYERNKVWADKITLWEDCVSKSPKKARIHYYLGNAYGEKKDFTKAYKHFKEAIKLKPNYHFPHFGLGFILEEQFKLDEAVKHYYKAIELQPNWWQPHYYLSFALAKQKKGALAIKHCKEAVRLNPGYAPAITRLTILQKSFN